MKKATTNSNTPFASETKPKEVHNEIQSSSNKYSQHVMRISNNLLEKLAAPHQNLLPYWRTQ